MTAYRLNEDVVAALKARLDADLPALVAEINAEADVLADGYTISVPTVLDYAPTPGELMGHTPVAIGIQDGPGTIGDDTGFSFTGHNEQSLIVYVSGEADQRALAWRLRRYLRAVATAVMRDRSLGGGTDGYGVRFKRRVPGPTLDTPEEPRTWATFAAIVIEVLTDE